MLVVWWLLAISLPKYVLVRAGPQPEELEVVDHSELQWLAARRQESLSDAMSGPHWESRQIFDINQLTIDCEEMQGIVSIRFGRFPYFFGSNHLCGGVPISTYLIVSAASCFFRRAHRMVSPKSIYVVIGCQNRFQADLRTMFLRVRDIFMKRTYVRSPDTDIAVLILKDPIPLDPEIPIMPIANHLPKEGTECYAMGWGRLFLNGPMVDDLTVRNVSVIDNGACAALYPYIIDNNLICTYNSDSQIIRPICQEDAGGPLICNGTLYGIISGFTDCTMQNVDFFVPMAHHYQWIAMLNLHDDSKLIFSALVLFAVLSVLILINKHRLC